MSAFLSNISLRSNPMDSLPGKSTLSVATAGSEMGSNTLPICRICHMPASENGCWDLLISPCRCAGSLQFIHSACLQFHHWRFPRVSRRDKILHVTFFINLVVMIACAVATVLCFLKDKGQINKFPRNKVNLTTEEVITLACGVLFFVSFFIAMSVQIKAKHTIYQLLVKFFTKNMQWEIDEYDKEKDASYSRPQYV